MKTTFIALVALLCLAPAAVPQEPPPEARPQELSAEATDALDRAREEVAQGRLQEAIDILEPLAQGEDPPPPIVGVLGALYVDAGRPGDALALLEPLAAGENAPPAVLYNAGRAALAVGRFEDAEAFLERSVALERATPAARELGLIRGGQGRYREAYLLLRPWSLRRPDDTEARLAAALCAVKLRRGPDAEELLAELPQDNPRVRLLWGELRMLQGDPEGALSMLRPLMGAADSEAVELDARRTMASAYLVTGRPSEAMAVLEGHVGLDPGLAVILSQAQHEAGDTEAALVTLQPFADRLLLAQDDLPKGDTGPAAGLAREYGRYLSAAGRNEEAVPFLELATRLDPGNKQGWQKLGQALAAVGRREDAEAALARFQEIVQAEVPAATRLLRLEKDVEDPTGRTLRDAMRLLEGGRGEQALEAIRQERQLSPQDVRTYLVESQALLILGRHQEALAAAEQAVEMAPEAPDPYYQRGVVQMAMDNLDGAESDLRWTLSLAPEHTAAMSDLAVLLIVKGSRDEAEKLLQRVLELRPGDTSAQQNLERLRARKQQGG